MSFVVGFTGSKQGMTNFQEKTVDTLLAELKANGYKYARHGMCVGSDAIFNRLAKLRFYWTIGHPGVDADGQVKHRSTCSVDQLTPEHPFLIRNRHIVDRSHAMLATPGQNREVTRSGTWATIRYARARRIPLYLIYPDGHIAQENVIGTL